MAEPLGDLVRTHYCGDLREAHVGTTVTLMGWAATRRDLGGVVFVDLRDREGLCQVVARKEVSEAAHAKADHVRSEYVLAVTGEVRARSQDTVNANLETGKVEVVAREIRVLSEAKTPVFPIEDEMAKGVVTVRDMARSTQEDVPRERALEHLKEMTNGCAPRRPRAHPLLRRAAPGRRGQDGHPDGLGGHPP